MQRCARIWATDGQSELHIAAPPALVSVQLKETRRGSLPRRLPDAGAVPCTEKPAECARVFTVGGVSQAATVPFPLFIKLKKNKNYQHTLEVPHKAKPCEIPHRIPHQTLPTCRRGGDAVPAACGGVRREGRRDAGAAGLVAAAGAAAQIRVLQALLHGCQAGRVSLPTASFQSSCLTHSSASQLLRALRSKHVSFKLHLMAGKRPR